MNLLVLDKKRRQLIIELQDCKHRKNVLAQSIAQKKKEAKNTDAIYNEINEMKKLSTKILQTGERTERDSNKVSRPHDVYS